MKKFFFIFALAMLFAGTTANAQVNHPDVRNFGTMPYTGDPYANPAGHPDVRDFQPVPYSGYPTYENRGRGRVSVQVQVDIPIGKKRRNTQQGGYYGQRQQPRVYANGFAEVRP